MKKRKLIFTLITIVLLFIVCLLSLFGVTKIRSSIKDTEADAIGLERDISVYDFYGNKTEFYEGHKTKITNSEVDNTILATVDSKSIQLEGSSTIIKEKGIINLMDTDNYKEKLKEEEDKIDKSAKESSGSILIGIDEKINIINSQLKGLKRIIKVKNEAGVIIGLFEGNNVLVEKSNLPHTTKILIDNKRMNIFNCEFTIIEL